VRAWILASVVAIASIAVVTPARAHNSEQVAKLSGKRVVGAKGDPDARGRADIRSAAEIETLCYKIRFTDAPPLTAAHIHQAVPGQNGPVVLTLFDSGTRRSPAKGCIEAEASLLESMQASPQGYYLDLHTKKRPGGALRGQLQNVNDSGYYETCDLYRPEADDARKAGTVIVSNGATAEEPMSLKIQAPAGTPTAPEEVLLNVQLTTQGQPMGFYARYEFGPAEDYDVIVQRRNGEEAARADGFNPGAVGPGAEPNENGGHSEVGAEQIDGLASRHCDGYTLRLVSKSGAGGEATLKLWTGEAQ
jgi:hypothetical protein